MYYVIYVLILVTASLNGMGCSLFWAVSANYVNRCATNKNKGLFNGILWMWVQLSFVTGNLMAAFIIPITSELFLYYVFTGICVICVFLFGLLKEPLPHPEKDIEIEVEDDAQLLEIPDKKPLNATTSVSPFDADLINKEVEASAEVSEIRATWNLLWTSRMMKLTPLLLWTAISQAVYQASFVPLLNMTMPKDYTKAE